MDGISRVNPVKHLGLIFDKRMKWRLHIKMIEAKAFKTIIAIYSLLKSERLRASIKLTLHKALMRSMMTYACHAWELAADTYLVKLQRMQNKVLRATGTFRRCTPSVVNEDLVRPVEDSREQTIRHFVTFSAFSTNFTVASRNCV
jgi:hypothetical protein